MKPCPIKAAALAAGKATYFTGVPCKNGHVAERRTDNRLCVECVKIRSRRYYHSNLGAERRRAREKQIEYRKANPVKVRQMTGAEEYERVLKTKIAELRGIVTSLEESNNTLREQILTHNNAVADLAALKDALYKADSLFDGTPRAYRGARFR
jgi:hypothetical protein